MPSWNYRITFLHDYRVTNFQDADSTATSATTPNHAYYSLTRRPALCRKEKTLRSSHRCSAIHHADGCPQYKQHLVAGALTANAPPPQGRTRLDALVTLAGYARRRREIWRNPSSLGEGVAPQHGAQ